MELLDQVQIVGDPQRKEVVLRFGIFSKSFKAKEVRRFFHERRLQSLGQSLLTALQVAEGRDPPS